ncbi:MAG TPA: phosphoglycerate kinase [Planktothrix sp.]|jgi:phosphoglycerate kinase
MKKTIQQAGSQSLRDKRVLVRVDFNVPQNEDRSVADDSRIRAALPTIIYLHDAGAKVILVSHLGRPKGKDEKYSLQPIAKRLENLLLEKKIIKVHFAPDCVGEVAQKAVEALKPGEVLLLENVRFYPEEEKNDPEFAKKLAALADVYVNDAFGAAHRAHASTEGVTKHVRPALAGMLMEKEIRHLSQALDDPTRPFATIIGGAKVSSKIGVLENLLHRVDVMIIGGAMAFSFLKARGLNVGKSLVEDDRLEYCRKLDKEARQRGVNLILPVDVVCAKEIKPGSATTIVAVDEIPADQMGLDVGPETTKLIDAALAECKTILWNGPMGVFEIEGFEKGTYKLIDTLVARTKAGCKTIVGGGDSVSALGQKGVHDYQLTHVSTGGGASLEFIEGIQLPGIACLDEAEAASVK